jgi:psp operon transcriptional activator
VTLDPFPQIAPPPEAEPSPPAWPRDLRAELDAIEKRFARDALATCDGNQKEAAAALSLSYDQMRGLVRKHQLARRGQK